MNAAQDVALEGLKAAPPVIVTGSVLFGMTPTEWVTALTVLYLVLQIGVLVPRYWAQFRDWGAPPGRKADESGYPPARRRHGAESER